MLQKSLRAPSGSPDLRYKAGQRQLNEFTGEQFRNPLVIKWLKASTLSEIPRLHGDGVDMKIRNVNIPGGMPCHRGCQSRPPRRERPHRRVPWARLRTEIAVLSVEISAFVLRSLKNSFLWAALLPIFTSDHERRM